MNFMGLLIFPFKRGGRVSRHPRSEKAEVVTHGDLYVNKHATCDFNRDNDYKQLNHRLMNVLCCTKAIFADSRKSPK